MRRNGYLWTSGVNLDTTDRFPDPDVFCWFLHFKFWLTLNSCHTWRFAWPTLLPSLKTLRLFVHQLRVITFPIDYHRKCVYGHCACAESRDPWAAGQKRYHFSFPWPDLPIHYTTSIGIRRRLRVVYSRASRMLKPWLRNFLCVTVWPWPLTFWP